MFIYLIKNVINQKCYVGQTVQTLEKRWKRHCWQSTQQSSRMAISKALSVHGIESFELTLLQTCDDQQSLNAAEQAWIAKLNTLAPHGYNLTTGGNMKGHLSDESKRKISVANQGRIRSVETKEKLSISHQGWIPSEVTREKWRQAFKGKKQAISVVEKRAEALAKTYTMLSPDGVEVTFTNMKRFCLTHSLSESKMNQVAKGKAKHHKGWKLP